MVKLMKKLHHKYTKLRTSYAHSVNCFCQQNKITSNISKLTPSVVYKQYLTFQSKIKSDVLWAFSSYLERFAPGLWTVKMNNGLKTTLPTML